MCQRFRLLQIQRQAALIAVDAQEIRTLAVDKRRTIAPRIVPGFRTFDFHHVRAHVR